MKSEKEDKATWVLIPPTILVDKRVPAGGKMVYGKVLGLMKSKGYCWGSNDYLGESLGLSKHTIKKYLRLLYKLDYLRFELIRDKKKEVKERRIYPTLGDRSILPRRLPRIPEYPKSIKDKDKEEIDFKKTNKGLEKVGDTLKDLKLK